MAFLGEGEQQSCTGEESVVSGGEDTGKDDSIDDAACCFRSGHLEDNGEGRGVRIAAVEVLEGVWHIKADEENGQDAG